MRRAAIRSRRRAGAASGAATTRRPPWLVELVVDAGGHDGRPSGDGRRGRPGVRRRPVPRRRGAAHRARSAAGPGLSACDIDAGGRRRGRAPRWAPTATVVRAPTPSTTTGARCTARRRRRRQPAVPVAAGGGDDAWRGQPPRRRPVRRRRRRVPRPRRSASPGPTAAASGSSCRSRSSPRATPRRCAPTLDACGRIAWSWWSPERRLRRPGARVRAGRSSSGAPAPATRWTDVVTASARPARRSRTSPPPARSATAAG